MTSLNDHPRDTAAQASYRTAMVALFDERKVTLPLIHAKTWTPTPAAPAVAPQEVSA